MRFAVDIESYGEHRVEELKPGGKDIRVSQANKREYVSLYIEWQLNRSIADLFSRFESGFYKLYRGEFTTNCDPEELELLICGSPVFDFHELEKVTRYDSGYTATSPTIKYFLLFILRFFWSVLHELDLEYQKKFLFFATGSDRAPVGGLGKMKFHITKHGEDGEQLPSAHTCFNHLLLPPYSTREKLKQKLLIAINNAEGFGLF